MKVFTFIATLLHLVEAAPWKFRKDQSLDTRDATTSTNKPVFAHYMVGSMTSSEAIKDVTEAKAVGFDAFALNTHDISSQWVKDALGYLFDAADQNDFKLFISFDMSWKIYKPSDIPTFLKQYIGYASYYTYDDRPFVSTYNGGYLSNDDWNNSFRQPLASDGINPYFVPDFDDAPGFPDNFINDYSVVDGAFSWENAWPGTGNAMSSVSDSVDQSLLQQAHDSQKTYMMPVSSYQFKYMGSGQDWYRIGEVNLPQRFGQVLALQPDFVELITWNDAGEGHYIGNFYPEQLAGTNIGDYADGFDHTGWQQLVSAFILAYKGGATSISSMSPGGSNPVGSLWYRTLLTTANCSSTIGNYEEAQDTINFAVVLPSSGYIIKVYSDNELIQSVTGNAGLNYNAVPGLKVGGGQRIEILDGTNTIVGTATGTKDVEAESTNAVCNWNYEVVGL